MALRFQEWDEVDRTARGGRPSLILLFALVAAITGVVAWLSGKSLYSYERDIAVGAACLWAAWLLVPIYEEFRARTKEIDGKVSAVEKAVTASKENHAELLEKLTAIEERLEALSEKVENLNPGEGVAYSTGGIREGLRTI